MKQSQYALSAWDYVMFAGLFVVSAGIGLFFAFRERKRVRNADDYLMGGRGMHAIPVAISMTSGFISAITSKIKFIHKVLCVFCTCLH